MKQQLLFLIIFLFSLSGNSQETFQVTTIPIVPSGDGLVGYANITMKPGCMGDPRLQVKVDRIVIQGIILNGERISTSIGNRSFPMDVVSGTVYFKGNFQNRTIGMNDKIYIQNGSISVKLNGFLDWLTVSEQNEEIHSMNCDEWRDFALNKMSRYLSNLEIYDESCLKADWNNTCLFYELKDLHKEQQESKSTTTTANSSWRDSDSESETSSNTDEEEDTESSKETSSDSRKSSSETSSSSSSGTSSSGKSREERKFERMQRYQARKQSQNEHNRQVAAGSAAATGSLMYLLGGFVYSHYGKTNPQRLYKGGNLLLNMDMGFGLNVHPMYFASEYETYEYDYIKSTKGSTKILFDFNVALQLGYDTNFLGGYGFAAAAPGISPIFDATQLNYKYGGRVFAGLKNLKVFAEYESGSRNYTGSDLLDSQEYGSGESNFSYNNVKAGIKISWYKNRWAPARNHIYLGVIEERISELEDGQSLQMIPQEQEPYVFTGFPTYMGYMFEWRHDHHGVFYARVFPKYPYTGLRGGKNHENLSSEGSLFFQVGFLRSFTGFF